MYQGENQAKSASSDTGGKVLQRAYNWAGNGYTQYGNANQLWRHGPANGDISALGATTVRYVGKADEFTGGSGPGGANSFTNIANYQNRYGLINGNTGATSGTVNGTAMNNNIVTYNHGHILPQQLGGGNAASGNIFQQNAGQNNSNPWKADEQAAANFFGQQGSKYVYYEVDMV